MCLLLSLYALDILCLLNENGMNGFFVCNTQLGLLKKRHHHMILYIFFLFRSLFKTDFLFSRDFIGNRLTLPWFWITTFIKWITTILYLEPVTCLWMCGILKRSCHKQPVCRYPVAPDILFLIANFLSLSSFSDFFFLFFCVIVVVPFPFQTACFFF